MLQDAEVVAIFTSESDFVGGLYTHVTHTYIIYFNVF